jgi:hypothetical protein
VNVSSIAGGRPIMIVSDEGSVVQGNSRALRLKHGKDEAKIRHENVKRI